MWRYQQHSFYEGLLHHNIKTFHLFHVHTQRQDNVGEIIVISQLQTPVTQDSKCLGFSAFIYI